QSDHAQSQKSDLLHYFTRFSSLMMFPAPWNLSMINSTYRTSTLMHRLYFGSNTISPLIASQFPSKASPINSPLALITGEPELPPVMSLLVMKPTGNSPLVFAYWP